MVQCVKTKRGAGAASKLYAPQAGSCSAIDSLRLVLLDTTWFLFSASEHCEQSNGRMGAALGTAAAAAAPPLRGATGAVAPPLVVTVLAGNPVTGAAVLTLLDTRDANALRRLHPAMVDAVARVPWADKVTVVVHAQRWRVAFPAAEAAALCSKDDDPPRRPLWRRGGTSRFDDWQLGAGRGSMVLLFVGLREVVLERRGAWNDSSREGDDIIRDLPPTIVRLVCREDLSVTEHARFNHLPALEVLDCTDTYVGRLSIASLPPSLRVLICCSFLGERDSLTLPHLPALRELYASGWRVSVSRLPPSLEIAEWSSQRGGLAGAHLPRLATLVLRKGEVQNDELATFPASLTHLDLTTCQLPPRASFSHLYRLRELNCSGTAVGNATIASLPPLLARLHINQCAAITRAARFDHLPALTWLSATGVALSLDAVAACRARGCFVPYETAVYVGDEVFAMTLLPNGLLALCTEGGVLRLWDPAGASTATGGTCLDFRAQVCDPDGDAVFMAALSATHIAVATRRWSLFFPTSHVAVWDIASVPPTRLSAVTLLFYLSALAVLELPTGKALAMAAWMDKRVTVWPVRNGHIRWRPLATLLIPSSRYSVPKLAVLPSGRLVTASLGVLQVWDVVHAACVATLRIPDVSLHTVVARPDGSVACLYRQDGGIDFTQVLLWQPSTSEVRILQKQQNSKPFSSIASLPDGRLVVSTEDGMVVVWDARVVSCVAAWPVVALPPSYVFASDLVVLPLCSDGIVRIIAGSLQPRVWRVPPATGPGNHTLGHWLKSLV